MPEDDASVASAYDDLGHYPGMFLDDATSDLFPISGEVEGEPVVVLRTDSDVASEMVVDGFARFSSHISWRDSVSEALCGFGNYATRILLASGVVFHEVAPVRDQEGVALGFSIIPVSHVRLALGSAWQVIRGDLPEASVPSTWFPLGGGLKAVYLPRNRVRRTRLPKQYRSLPDGLRALKRAGNAVPQFALDNLRPDGTQRVGYDLTELRSLEMRAVATITRATGWTARQAFSELTTSYYHMVRFLRFEKFKVHLRQTALTAINDLLGVAGEQVGFRCRVELQHLPTLDEVGAARERLRKGEFNFVEALKQFALYSRTLA